MNRRETIRAAAREIAAYIAKHPTLPRIRGDLDLRWRIMGLTGGGDGYTDHELDFLERAVRFINRKERHA